jgi:CHAT domain-containing protein/tetratricopeptide (TPR) repeat protein
MSLADTATGRRESRRRTVLTLCMPLLGLVALSDSTRESALPRDDVVSLTPFDGGESLPSAAKQLVSDSRDRYRFELRAGDYLELVVDHQGIDAGASLFAPGGEVLADVPYRQQGDVVLASIAPASGTYLVEIRSLDGPRTAGRYVIRVRERHRATATDKERIEAYRLFTEAEALRADWHVDAAPYVLERYGAALNRWSSAGDRHGQALATARLGEVHRTLGKRDDALREMLESLRFNDASDIEPHCTALTTIARIRLDVGATTDAYDDAKRARTLGIDRGSPRCEADALNVLGEIASLNGRSRESLVLYRRALAISAALRDRRGQARALLNLGYSQADLAEIGDAQRSYDSALGLWREVADRQGEAETLTGLGQLLGMAGEHQQALARYQQARALFERLGDRDGAARVLASIGIRHSNLGDLETAVDSLAGAAGLFASVKQQNGEAAARLNLAMCLSLLGRQQEALDQYAQALLISKAVSDARLEARALEGVGQTYAALGQYENASTRYEQAKSLARQVGDPLGEVYASNGLGDLMHRRGRDEEALKYFNDALRLSEQSKYPFVKSLVVFNMAQAESALGRLPTALEHVKSSLELVEGLRTTVASLDLRASYLASVRDRHELEIDLLMRLNERNPAADFSARAFEAGERARARAFLDGLAQARGDIRAGVAPQLLDRETSVRRSLNAAAQRLATVPTDAAHEKETAALTAEVAREAAAYKEIEGQIRAESPRYASLMQPQPLTLPEVQRLIADDRTVLLQYFLGKERSYVWAVTRAAMTTHALPARGEIERLVRPYRDGLASPPRGEPPARNASRERSIGGIVRKGGEHTSEIARDLSQMLLGPLARHLGNARVLIVADGILHGLPFTALPDPRTLGPKDGPRPLVADHEIVNLPSASTLALLRGDWNQPRRWQKSAMVFADPVYDRDDPRLGPVSAAARSPEPGAGDTRAIAGVRVTRLTQTRREARGIAALATPADVALDFDASRDVAMTTDLTRYQIVHFAAHGIVDNQHPELSGIVLSLVDKKGQTQDGFLRLHDIYNLKIPADLVVLSACSTALGKEVIGEGLIGLVRGFMYAGSRRVVASLWEVDDEATSELMTRFYRGMFEKKLTPPAALRAAQLELLATPRWSAPFYWAAFALQGDWN